MGPTDLRLGALSLSAALLCAGCSNSKSKSSGLESGPESHEVVEGNETGLENAGGSMSAREGPPASYDQIFAGNPYLRASTKGEASPYKLQALYYHPAPAGALGFSTDGVFSLGAAAFGGYGAGVKDFLVFIEKPDLPSCVPLPLMQCVSNAAKLGGTNHFVEIAENCGGAGSPEGAALGYVCAKQVASTAPVVRMYRSYQESGITKYTWFHSVYPERLQQLLASSPAWTKGNEVAYAPIAGMPGTVLAE